MTSSYENLSITAIMITYKRSELLAKAVESLIKAISVSPSKLDLVFVVNGHCPDSINYLNNINLNKKTINCKILISETRITPAAARNLALEKVKTDWILFLDDDVEVPIEFLNEFSRYLIENANAQIVGGPNLTNISWGPQEGLIGWMLQEPLVSGPMAYRYRKGGSAFLNPSFKLTLCNLFVNASIFKNIKLNPSYFTGEENVFLHYADKNKFNTHSCDKLFVWHKRRDNLQSFFQQIEIYGIGRGQLIKNGQQGATFALASLTTIILIFYSLSHIAITAAILMIYLGILIFRYFSFSRKIDVKVIFFIFSYWAHYFKGILAGLMKRQHSVIQKKFVN